MGDPWCLRIDTTADEFLRTMEGIVKFRTIIYPCMVLFSKAIFPNPSICRYYVQYSTGKRKRTTNEGGFATTVQFRSPMHLMTQFSFAMEIRGSAWVMLDNKGPALRMETRGKALISIHIGSLVIASERGQVGGQNVAVACFYFNFAAQKERSSTDVLGVQLERL